KDVKAERTIQVEHGKPLLFGANSERGLRFNQTTFSLEAVTIGQGGVTERDILVHDETNATLAGLLSRMKAPELPMALGVLYAVTSQTYERDVQGQQKAAVERSGRGDLQKLLLSGDTWTV